MSAISCCVSVSGVQRTEATTNRQNVTRAVVSRNIASGRTSSSSSKVLVRSASMPSQGGPAPFAATPGKVRNVPASEFSKLIADGWIVLDVRPPNEREKAPLQNALEVPLFVPDESSDFGTLIKKSTAFGMGGWWLGGTHMIPNQEFLATVQASVPDKESAKILVVCQKGLRSLSACEQLARVGYQNIAWINGGLDTARPGNIPTKNGVDVRVGGIGGLSEVLGWTEVQQEAGTGFAGGYQNILKFFAVILALDLVWFVWTILNPSD
ncbi:hypothetical protein M9434_007119 [Picochlorum sp. BPE23]|nr:hypothetical protein M9434_007119 [Picochlorum sp. BPE23]KAI8102589.1 hypothetical protein M9435_006187 [Picochlorum sp. BPE23]